MLHFKWTLLLAILMALTSSQASAQEWAWTMFRTRAYDFGTLARGAKAEYRFVLANIYKEDVHIASVSTSRSGMVPRVSKTTLKSRESADIVVELNTVAHAGARIDVITVVFDQPFFAQVQLRVSCFIRQDLVLDPGEIDFGRVEEGKPAECRINIRYAGGAEWAITDVRTDYSHLEAELVPSEGERAEGQVKYQMVVYLKKDAPVGEIDEHLAIVTNDAEQNRITVRVRGKVEAAGGGSKP